MGMGMGMGLGGGEDEVGALSLTMVASNGDGSETLLIPQGDKVGVTCDNAYLYVALLAHHRMNTQISGQVGAFLRGFREVVPLAWMRFFGPSELQLLLSGEEVLNVPLLVADLCSHVEVMGFTPGEDYMLAFWRTLAEFSVQDFSLFLQFVTSNPRPPLLGFASLKPKFGITMVPAAAGVQANSRLPTAATCFNLLKLPFYPTRELLRDKLLEAVRECSGFYLS